MEQSGVYEKLIFVLLSVHLTSGNRRCPIIDLDRVYNFISEDGRWFYEITCTIPPDVEHDPNFPPFVQGIMGTKRTNHSSVLGRTYFFKMDPAASVGFYWCLTPETDYIDDCQVDGYGGPVDTIALLKRLVAHMDWQLVNLDLVVQVGLTPKSICSSLASCGEEDKAGWRQMLMLLQRRRENSTSFDRSWKDYVSGFGHPMGDFWIGLEALHQLTTSENCSLLVRLWLGNGTSATASFKTFKVGGPDERYRLIIGGMQGEIRDLFKYNNGSTFSTYDNDSDLNKNINCAKHQGSGWWFRGEGDFCGPTNVNDNYWLDTRLQRIVGSEMLLKRHVTAAMANRGPWNVWEF